METFLHAVLIVLYASVIPLALWSIKKHQEPTREAFVVANATIILLAVALIIAYV